MVLALAAAAVLVLPALVPASVTGVDTVVAAADLGFRAKAVLTRYPEGIMMQRTGAGPIWIPDEMITDIRAEKSLAGKALTHDGILAIRWRLPSGVEIDTGFRADDRRDYLKWLPEEVA